MPAVLVDLDGTLCDTAHRAHMLDNKPRDWAAYSAACGGDTVIESVRDVVKGLHRAGWMILLTTGRIESARTATEEWLDENAIPYHELSMRRTDDHRRNPDIKASVAENFSLSGHTIELAIDDHPGVAEAYAELGIPTLVVARPEADQGILAELAETAASQGIELPSFIAEALTQARDTFGRKNADYAKDGAWRSNFDEVAFDMGVDALFVVDHMIAVKQARLRALRDNARDPLNEGLIDTYLDRMVYAIIAYALLLDEGARA